MDLLYHIIIGTVILAVSPYILLRMVIDRSFRDEIIQRLRGGADIPRQQNSIWVHAASVGEVRAAKTLINSLKERRDQRSVILSTFTRTGYDLACAEGIAPVFRLPPDFPLWLEPLFDKLDPSVLILVEAELWPSLLRLCKRRGVPALLVNGRMSEKSSNRYSTVKPLFGWLAAPIKLFSMRTADDADRIKRLGVSEAIIHVTGNLKFDALAPEENPGREKSSPLVVFGSTRPGDEAPILDAIVRLQREAPGTRFVIAPRHIDRIPEVLRMIQDRGLEFALHSRLEKKEGGDMPLILLDQMGELNHYYAQSSIAFVGGGFDPGFGGQNILEPAAFYQPVIFGRHMSNFAEEARLLSASGGGIQINGPDELYSTLLRLLIRPDELRRLGKLAGETVKSNRGATKRNVDLIERFLK